MPACAGPAAVRAGAAAGIVAAGGAGGAAADPTIDGCGGTTGCVDVAAEVTGAGGGVVPGGGAPTLRVVDSTASFRSGSASGEMLMRATRPSARGSPAAIVFASSSLCGR